MSRNLISVDALKAGLDDPGLVVLDCSWYLPAQNRNGIAEYGTSHIPGARFFDIDRISDQSTDLPHMIPSENYFSECVEALGISNSSQIVVYDGAGLFSAARVWWLFRLFGQSSVRVLDGGLPAWIDAGYPTTDELPDVVRGNFVAKLEGSLVAGMQDIRKNCDTGESRILDARPEPRFSGQAPEPRPELSSGHMPGATSLPFSDLLDDGRLKSPTEIENVLAGRGVSREQPIVTSCGSGVTAAIITLALDEAGWGLQKLYDGSWTEWASDPGNPIVID